MTSSHIKVLLLLYRKFFSSLDTSLTLQRISFPGEKPLGPGCHAFWGGDIQVSPDLRIKDGILFVKMEKLKRLPKTLKSPHLPRMEL